MAALLLVAAARAHALVCSATIGDVDFGAPSLLSESPTDALATVTVTCTGIPLLFGVKLCPSISDGSGGAYGAARRLTGPGDATLDYQLYEDSSRTLAWGSVDDPELGTVPVMTLPGTLSGAATATRTLYARLYGGQSTAPPGVYVSEFAGAETAFTYALYLISSTGSCSGFVGTATIHPEFEVEARPPASCNVDADDLVFPTSGVLSAAVEASTQLQIGCTARTAYTVSLDDGLTGSGPTERKMTATGGYAIVYGLYRDSAHASPWGSASAGQGVAGTGTGTTQSLTVYGYVPAQATPAPGSYSDRIVVTLTY
ncbi:MAG TPA: spore coat protein U domain-containing protein [Dokdonella sp.]